MKKYLSLFTIILFLLQGCHNADKTGMWQNDKIDPALRTKIGEMNKQVFNCLATNDHDHLIQLFSDSLKEAMSPDFETEFLPRMQKMLNGKKYRVFDEFDVKNESPVMPVNIIAGTGDSAYFFEINSLTKETYVSMLVSCDSFNEVMVTLVYGNFNGQWKINILRGDDYTVFRKNAAAHYRNALELKKNGDIVDAVSTMTIADKCSKPAGSYFKYKIANEMKTFSDSMIKEAIKKYPFPYMVNLPKSKVLIFNMHYEFINGNMAQMLMYLTDINVRDSVALKTENDELQRNIGTVFEGMDKNNRNIIYRAYNEKPDGKNDPRYYGFVQTTK